MIKHKVQFIQLWLQSLGFFLHKALNLEFTGSCLWWLTPPGTSDIQWTSSTGMIIWFSRLAKPASLLCWNKHYSWFRTDICLTTSDLCTKEHILHLNLLLYSRLLGKSCHYFTWNRAEKHFSFVQILFFQLIWSENSSHSSIIQLFLWYFFMTGGLCGNILKSGTCTIRNNSDSEKHKCASTLCYRTLPVQTHAVVSSK